MLVSNFAALNDTNKVLLLKVPVSISPLGPCAENFLVLALVSLPGIAITIFA